MAKSKAKQLAEKYGGKWKYDGISSWWCDDNLRHVARVSTNSYDEPGYFPPAYYLYGDGIPSLIHFEADGVLFFP